MDNSSKGKTLNKHLSLREQEAFFEKVYTEYFDRLFGYALVLTKSESLSKDIVSEVFLNLWDSKKDLHSIKELKSYLFTCVKNLTIRSLAKDPTSFHSDDYEHAIRTIDMVNPEDLLVGKELDEFINKVINNLPPQCKLVFQMVKEDNKRYEEVAQELGISKDTVKYHIKTSLKKIRLELEDYFDDTPIIKWASIGSLVLVLTDLLLSI